MSCAKCCCYIASLLKQGPNFYPASSMMGAMETEFRKEAALRLRVLDGERIEEGDLQPLYSSATEKLRCVWLRTLAARRRQTAQNLLTPNIRAFRTLYKAFAGAAAHLRLPQGCFFGGSSVVACTQIPKELYTKKLASHLYEYDLLCEQAWQVAYMALRKFELPRAVVKHILNYAEEVDNAEALRERICDLCPEPRYFSSSADVFGWTNNGFGCYARSCLCFRF